MSDEVVSRYLSVISSKEGVGAINLFISVNALSRARGSMSTVWLQGVDRLKNMNHKRRLKAERETTTKAHKEF